MCKVEQVVTDFVSKNPRAKFYISYHHGDYTTDGEPHWMIDIQITYGEGRVNYVRETESTLEKAVTKAINVWKVKHDKEEKRSSKKKSKESKHKTSIRAVKSRKIRIKQTQKR